MPQRTIGRDPKGDIGSLNSAAYGSGGGLNVKAVPQAVLDNQLVQAYNGYLRPSGGFQMRNGMTTFGTAVGSGGPVIGLADFYQQIQGGDQVNPITKQVIAQVGSSLYNYTTSTLIGSIGVGAQPMTYVRAIDPNDSNYPDGQTDVLVICTGVGGPYVYDGVNLYTPAGWSAASGAEWCELVNGIVYFGGIATAPRTVYGSGDGAVASFETLPSYYQFNTSQPVTGLGAIGTGATALLAIGMLNGVTVIYGSGPSNLVDQEYVFTDGVAAGRTMIYFGGLLYFLGRQAVYAFDGQNPIVSISDNVEPWILNDPYVQGYPMAGSRSSSFSFIYNNRLHVCYASVPDSSTPDTILVYDLILRGWTVLQSTPGVYSACLLDAPGDPSPAQTLVGSSVSGQVYTWDVQPPAGEYPFDDGVPILCTMQTKYFKLGEPGTTKMLTRIYPELFISGPFTGIVGVTVDYGQEIFSNIVATIPVTGSLWDVALWDVGIWGAGQVWQSYNAPESRIDFNGIQGDAFSYTIETTGAASPWQYAGTTSVFSQKGKS